MPEVGIFLSCEEHSPQFLLAAARQAGYLDFYTRELGPRLGL